MSRLLFIPWMYSTFEIMISIFSHNQDIINAFGCKWVIICKLHFVLHRLTNVDKPVLPTSHVRWTPWIQIPLIYISYFFFCCYHQKHILILLFFHFCIIMLIFLTPITLKMTIFFTIVTLNITLVKLLYPFSTSIAATSSVATLIIILLLTWWPIFLLIVSTILIFVSTSTFVVIPISFILLLFVYLGL